MISEDQFQARVKEFRDHIDYSCYDLVTGPGRSGAIASVYVSHQTGIPFLPYRQKVTGKRVLVIDTVANTGRTIRKAERLYDTKGYTLYEHDGKLKFWFEGCDETI